MIDARYSHPNAGLLQIEDLSLEVGKDYDAAEEIYIVESAYHQQQTPPYPTQHLLQHPYKAQRTILKKTATTPLLHLINRTELRISSTNGGSTTSQPLDLLPRRPDTHI